MTRARTTHVRASTETRGCKGARGLPVVIVARAVVWLGFAWIGYAVPAVATPYLPTDDAQPLEHLPSAGSKSVRELRQLHADLARSPENMALALRVATGDIQIARAEADPRYNGYAEAALAPWINLPKPPDDILVMRATLSQSRHDFGAALHDLDRVIADNPDNAQAWLTRATILQVQGQYPKALGNCLSLSRLSEMLVAVTCIANVESVSGKAKAAYQELSRALDDEPQGANPQIRLWALTFLAETAARLGDRAAADRHFQQALATGLPDGYLLGAYADFLLDEGRPAEVLTLLKDKTRIDPLLLRLTLAEQRLQAPEFAAHLADLTDRFAASRMRGDTIHRREEARFTLDLLKQPAQALRLAQENWNVQREPWDARVLLAAAAAARQPSAARPVQDWLASTRMEDVHIASALAPYAGDQQ